MRTFKVNQRMSKQAGKQAACTHTTHGQVGARRLGGVWPVSAPAGPDAIPAMAIMVQEVGAYIQWAGMRVHMMKSEIVGVNFKNGERVATDNDTLNRVPFAALAPDEPYE